MITLIKLAKLSSAEGKQLAKQVKKGRLTRADIEAAREAYPTDIEPVIALGWLDRWGL